MLALLTGCSHAPPTSGPQVHNEGEAKYFGSMLIHRYRLDNGLKILVLEDHSAPTFAYQVWYRVGSKDERPGRTGLAHLFEHLMFKGTKNHPQGEFDKILEAAGAEGENASTSRDFTDYVQSLPAGKLDLIASLEADRMENLLVNKASFDSEREVVQNERRMRNENSPDGTLYEKLFEVAFVKHSYHWPVIGYAKDLEETVVTDCVNFYKKYYSPNNATVVIVGNVNADNAAETVNKYYGAFRPANLEHPAPPTEPAQREMRVQTIPVKSIVEKIYLGYHIPDVNSPDYPAIEALRSVLAEGRSSRLYRRLVDSGLATSVEAYSGDAANPSLLMIIVNMQKGKEAKKAIQAIRDEARKLRKGTVKPEELQLAVNQYKFSLFDELATNHRKAFNLGFYQTIAGNYARSVEIVADLVLVDQKRLQKMAQTYLVDQNLNVVIGAPIKGK